MPDPDAPEALPVEISMNAVGRGSVVVDGVDLSKYIRAVHVSGGVDAPPRVILDLIPAVEIDAKAEVLIRRLKPAPDEALVEITAIGDEWRRFSSGERIIIERGGIFRPGPSARR